MRIGLVISSLTQNITYISCLVSLGYEVIPIILSRQTIASKNNILSDLIESIADQKIIFIDELIDMKLLDAIILMNDDNLVNINYSSILKENAPLILGINNESNILNYSNLHVINCNSKNIIENCNNVISTLEKVLKK